MKEKLVRMVGFYPTRSARVFIARVVRARVGGGGEAWRCVPRACHAMGVHVLGSESV